MPDNEQTKEFLGTYSEMRISPWLASEDLPDDREITVEVERVFEHRNAKMAGGRVVPLAHSLKFKGKDKRMFLNATNKRAMKDKFGKDSREWIGKKVVIFVQSNVRNPETGRNDAKGLRIK